MFLQLLRNHAAKRVEECFVLGEFFLPFLVIDSEKIRNGFVIDVETIKIEIMRTGQPADRRFDCPGILFTAIDDPFEHAHVLAEARPEKFSIRAFAEPIHVEDERRIRETFSDTDPMPEIIADIVSAERQHRHRIAANFSTAPVAAAVVSDAMVAPR